MAQVVVGSRVASFVDALSGSASKGIRNQFVQHILSVKWGRRSVKGQPCKPKGIVQWGGGAPRDMVYLRFCPSHFPTGIRASEFLSAKIGTFRTLKGRGGLDRVPFLIPDP